MDEPRKQPASPPTHQGGPASPQGGPPPPNIPSLPDSSDESTRPATPPLGELPRSPQPPRQEIRQQPQPFRPEQKSVYLERGEVRGMGKDIARVREEEARIEQQRIAALKTHKETEEERKKEKIRELAELRNGVIDADGCFRELYPEFRNDPTLNYSRWFMAYRDGFEGMPNNFEGRDNRFFGSIVCVYSPINIKSVVFVIYLNSTLYHCFDSI